MFDADIPQSGRFGNKYIGHLQQDIILATLRPFSLRLSCTFNLKLNLIA